MIGNTLPFLVKISCIVASVLGNILVIIATITDRGVRRIPNNVFICSLAVSDLMTGAYVMTIGSLDLIYCLPPAMPTNTVNVRVAKVFRWLFLRSSSWNLCVIAFDRYQYVKGAQTYKNAMSGRKVVMYALSGWLLGAVSTAFLLCGEMIGGTFEGIIHISSHAIELSVTNMIVWSSYHRALRLTKQRMKGRAVADRKLIIRRTSKIIFILIVAFDLIYIPQGLIHIYFTFKTLNEDNCTLIETSNWIVYCNSIVNPIVYALFNEHFRTAMINALKCRGSNKPNEPKTATATISVTAEDVLVHEAEKRRSQSTKESDHHSVLTQLSDKSNKTNDLVASPSER